MNEMYEYLKNHAYISYNKKSNYQFELSEERAECIANKYDSLIKDLEQQVKKQKEVIDKVIEYLEEHIKYECDNAFDGMQFYSYHLYDFNKQELLDILKEVSK